MKKKSKFNKIIILIISVIILCTMIGTAIIFFKNNINKSNEETISKTEKTIIQTDNPKNTHNFFPSKSDLNQIKIYSLIRIKNGIPFFKKEILSLILNQVIKKGSFINGKLHYWYKYTNNYKKFEIAFQWKSSSGKSEEKTYIIEIND